MTNAVTHHAEMARYELEVDGRVGSYAEYERQNGTLVFTHTVTSPRLRGQGLAEVVVRHALDDARRQQLTVVPQCWYVAQFIDSHPEYRDLLAAASG